MVRLIDAKHLASIGTWNVRTLWKDGSLVLLVSQLNKWFRWDISGLSEVCRMKEDIVEHAGYKLLYSSEEKTHQGGVGLLLSKKASKSLIDWNPRSSRLISVRVTGQGYSITIIQAYVPVTSQLLEPITRDDAVDDFYKTLQHTIDKMPRRDIKILMGDFKAQVGMDIVTWKGVLRRFGYGSMNDRGERLQQFCRLNNLNTANTWFSHKPSRKWTWCLLSDRMQQIIDHDRSETEKLHHQCSQLPKHNRTKRAQ